MSNGLLSASGYGDYEVTVIIISHGVRVISGAPDQARNHRAFYISKRTSSTFSLGLVFTSHEDYAKFGRWLQGYGRQVSTPNTPVGAMRVLVPARKFDRVGVPVSGGTYGEAVGEFVHRLTLRFEGAREEGDFKSPAVSKFILPGTNDEGTSAITDATFFYPAGIQLKGGGSMEDALYGLPEGTTKVLNIISTIFGGFGGQQSDPASTGKVQGAAGQGGR